MLSDRRRRHGQPRPYRSRGEDQEEQPVRRPAAMTFEEASTGMASKAWLQLLARRAAEAAKVSYRARGGEVEEKRRRRRKRRPQGEVAPTSERCDASPYQTRGEDREGREISGENSGAMFHLTGLGGRIRRTARCTTGVGQPRFCFTTFRGCTLTSRSGGTSLLHLSSDGKLLV